MSLFKYMFGFLQVVHDLNPTQLQVGGFLEHLHVKSCKCIF